jgi:DNA-binding beta-propeller fold protein YncE
VLAFDLPTGRHAIIGKDKKNPISRPYGLDTDDAGNLYVVDGKQKRVFMYNRDGDFIKNIGNADQFSMISYLTVAPDGSKLYVVDTGGVESTKHEVVVFDTETGDRLSSFGKRGNGPGDLNLPKGITVAADGTLYVVDSGNFRVNHYNPDGTFIGTFGSIGRQPGQFSRPKSVSTDKGGNVYVSDAAFGNFQIFNDQGQLLLWIGSRHQYGRRAEFFLPSGIEVDEDGRVLMVDQYHKKIDIFRPANLEQADGYMGLKKTEE